MSKQTLTAPCMKCEERQAGCHANCEKYKAWKAEYDTKAEAIKTARNMSNKNMRQELLTPSMKNRIERRKQK